MVLVASTMGRALMRSVARLVCLFILAACPALAQQPATQTLPTPPTSAAPSEDGQWTMPAKNYASTRYSDLDEITTDNVKNLQVAFTFSTGVNRGQESAPLVVGSTMYVLTPYPNILYALDLTQARRAAEVEVQPEARRRRAGRRLLRCGQPRRHLRATAGSSSTRSTPIRSPSMPDTGQEVWKTKVGNINIGETMTMAPLVVKDKVLVGNSRRRIRRARLDQGARRRKRQDRLEGLQHGPGPGRADRPGLQAVLRQRQGQGPRRHDLAAAGLAARRRHGLGLDLLRPGPEPASIYGTGNPGPWNRGSAARRQQVDLRHLRARPRTPARPAGSISGARTTSTTRTASTSRSCSTWIGTGSRARCSSAPSATATSTCSTAPPARSSRPSLYHASTRPRGRRPEDRAP